MVNFKPILLGSDLNVYGMARAIHEAYGIVSEAYAQSALSPTKNSSIVSVNLVDHFNDPTVFIDTLLAVGQAHAADTLLLIPCGDDYAKLVAQFREELAQYFVLNSVDSDLFAALSDKASFYGLCEQHNLPYPKTQVITEALYREGTLTLPFAYPVVVKASNSVAYANLMFENKQKAFFVNSAEEFAETLDLIYSSGYTDSLVIQEFIPGDDSKMRVLNAYVDTQHNVRMMFLGRPLLEDPSPLEIGNYVAILPDYNQAVFEQIKQFLTAINYQGFVNMDMKYDERDGQFKVFELNLRQGRSSFFVTLNGYNLSTYLVNDVVLHQPLTETVYGTGDKLWIEVPKKLLLQYVNPTEKAVIRDCFKRKNYGGTLRYRQDWNMMRRLYLERMYQLYLRNFKKYFNHKKGEL